MFLQATVILSTGGGVSASVHAGIPPPRPDTLRTTPPRPDSRHPPAVDTPLDQITPRADIPQSRHPPREQTPPRPDTPWTRHHPEQTPPRSRSPQTRHPLGTTPLEQTPPSPRADTPPCTTPWEQIPSLGPDTPMGSRLQHTVNEWPVHILLECILVLGINTHVLSYPMTLSYSAIHKAVGSLVTGRSQKPPGGTPSRDGSCQWLPLTANGHFCVPQELYQFKSWNGREPWGRRLCE